MQKIYIWASVILHHRTHAATSFLVLTITSFFENSEPLKAYIELRICQLKCSIHCSIISPWFFVRWKTLNSKILVSFFDEMKLFISSTLMVSIRISIRSAYWTKYKYRKNGTIWCPENCMASCQNSLFQKRLFLP